MTKAWSKVLNVFLSTAIGLFSAGILQRTNNMFFYNVFIGAFLSMICSYILSKFTNGRFFVEKIFRPYLLSISALLSFALLSTIPLTVDRSYSVWLLKDLAVAQASREPLSRENLIDKSQDFFSPSNGQLERRIVEQEKIGNIRINSKGEIELTRKGLAIAKFNELVGLLFGLEPKYSKIELP
jgi:hypothetical protein